MKFKSNFPLSFSPQLFLLSTFNSTNDEKLFASYVTRSEYIQSDISEDRNNNRWNLTSGQTLLAFPSPSGAPDPHPACQPNLFPIFEFSAYPRHVPKKSLLLSPILVLDRSAISAALNPVVRSLSNPFVSPRLLGYNKTFPFFSLHVYVDWPTFREFQILLCEGRGLFVPVELIFWYLYIYINWWPTWYANFEGQMYTTLLTMFSFFFFFFWNGKNCEIFIYWERLGERRWNLNIDGHENDGHTCDLCVSLGELDGPVIVPTEHLAVYCTLLYLVC